MMNSQRIPSAEGLERGMCAVCLGTGGRRGALKDCQNCAGTGSFLFNPKWTKMDEMRLRSFLESGRGLRYAAIQLDRPIDNVRIRAAELRIEVRRPV
jgi:hypothetical protein